jgi:hypothetical protein
MATGLGVVPGLLHPVAHQGRMVVARCHRPCLVRSATGRDGPDLPFADASGGIEAGSSTAAATTLTASCWSDGMTWL